MHARHHLHRLRLRVSHLLTLGRLGMKCPVAGARLALAIPCPGPSGRSAHWPTRGTFLQVHGRSVLHSGVMPMVGAAQKLRWDFRSPRFRYHKNSVAELGWLLLNAHAPHLESCCRARA